VRFARPSITSTRENAVIRYRPRFRTESPASRSRTLGSRTGINHEAVAIGLTPRERNESHPTNGVGPREDRSRCCGCCPKDSQGSQMPNSSSRRRPGSQGEDARPPCSAAPTPATSRPEILAFAGMTVSLGRSPSGGLARAPASAARCRRGPRNKRGPGRSCGGGAGSGRARRGRGNARAWDSLCWSPSHSPDGCAHGPP
jgi:hypothetical protein